VRNPDRIVQEILQRVHDLSEDAGVEALVKTDTPSQEDGRSAGLVKHDAKNPPAEAPQTSRGTANPYGFRTYDSFPARQMASREKFYYAAESRNGLKRLAGEIQVIVKMESPVHSEAVARKIAAVYGIERVGSNVRLTADRAIKLGASEKMFKLKDDFLWSNDGVVPRVPGPSDDPRPIEEVSYEEIGAVLEVIVEKEIGISRDSLVRTTARVLGHDRAGSKVEERIGEAIDRLFTNGRFSSYGEQITIKPPQE
jgi:hypothetical protein